MQTTLLMSLIGNFEAEVWIFRIRRRKVVTLLLEVRSLALL